MDSSLRRPDMLQSRRPQPAIPTCSTVARAWSVAIALVLLFGSVLSPLGLVRSHGSAALHVLDHGESEHAVAHHGHSHEHEAPITSSTQVHHVGDHSHDHAHALPVGMPGWVQGTAIWHERPIQPGAWSSLDGPERPPRA